MHDCASGLQSFAIRQTSETPLSPAAHPIVSRADNADQRPTNIHVPVPVPVHDPSHEIAYVHGIKDTRQPVNTLFLINACTPQLPSTTCVIPKSTATDMSEMASSSLSFCVVIKKWRIFRNASRSARSTDDFL